MFTNGQPEKPGERVSLLRRLLGRVSRRLVARRLANGALVFAGTVFAATLMLFGADRLTLFPAVLRLVAGLSLAIGGLWLLYRRIIVPALRRPDVAGAAGHLENRFHQLDGFALSAAQLALLPRTRSSASSQALVEMTVDEALGRLRDTGADRIAPTGIRLRFVAFAVAALVGWGAVWLLFPADTLTFVDRFLHPSQNIAYPTRTKIVSVKAPGTLPRGGSFTAEVRAQGFLPDEAAFRLFSGTRARQVYTGGANGLYVLKLKRVREDFSFDVAVGDARSVKYDVKVVDPPRVASIAADLVYPEYTRLPPATLAGGDISALEGTAVSLSADFNKPVRSARVVFEDAKTVDPALTPDNTAARLDFDVRRTTTYHVNLVDNYGFKNTAPATYRITAETDKAPFVTLERPTRDITAVPAAVIPIRGKAGDDYGLSFVRLCYTIKREDGNTQQGQIILTATTPELRLDVSHAWDLSTLGLTPGDEVVYYLSAEDNLPEGAQEATSEKLTVRIVSTADKLAEIEAMTRRIQANLRTLERRQEETKSAVENLPLVPAEGVS